MEKLVCVQDPCDIFNSENINQLNSANRLINFLDTLDDKLHGYANIFCDRVATHITKGDVINVMLIQVKPNSYAKAHPAEANKSFVGRCKHEYTKAIDKVNAYLEGDL